MSGGVRWMNNVLPKLNVLVEHIPENGYVATARDEDGCDLCDGLGPTAFKAIRRCLTRLPGNVPHDLYDVVVTVLNPSEDESDADIL